MLGFSPTKSSLSTHADPFGVKLHDSFESACNMGDEDARRAAWKNLGDKISQRFWFLDGEILAAKARRRTGLEEFGDPPSRTAVARSHRQPGTRG